MKKRKYTRRQFKSMRRAGGMTQRECAAELGCSEIMVSYMETGRRPVNQAFARLLFLHLKYERGVEPLPRSINRSST